MSDEQVEDFCYAEGDEGSQHCAAPKRLHCSVLGDAEFWNSFEGQRHLIQCLREDHLIHHTFVGLSAEVHQQEESVEQDSGNENQDLATPPVEMEAHSKLSAADFDNAAFYMFRYCLGRQTYAVPDCVEILTRNWSWLTMPTRIMIKKEIIQAFDQNRYGSEEDRAAWATVLDLDDPDVQPTATASARSTQVSTERVGLRDPESFHYSVDEIQRGIAPLLACGVECMACSRLLGYLKDLLAESISPSADREQGIAELTAERDALLREREELQRELQALHNYELGLEGGE